MDDGFSSCLALPVWGIDQETVTGERGVGLFCWHVGMIGLTGGWMVDWGMRDDGWMMEDGIQRVLGVLGGRWLLAWRKDGRMGDGWDVVPALSGVWTREGGPIHRTSAVI